MGRTFAKALLTAVLAVGVLIGQNALLHSDHQPAVTAAVPQVPQPVPLKHIFKILGGLCVSGLVLAAIIVIAFSEDERDYQNGRKFDARFGDD